MSLSQKLWPSTSEKSKQASGKPEEALDSFIKEEPNARYMFDSERDAQESEICREGNMGRKCIKLHMYSTQMFQAMQNQGFFCALPLDPTRTHIECTPIPKS